MNLYFISGLGADRRAFQRIGLPDRFTVHYLDWIPPQAGEGLNAYAKRMSTFIDQSKPFALIGLSFGGMIASAMNQYLKPEKTILISSISNAEELPWYLKALGRIRLHKLLPSTLLRDPNIFAFWFFGAKTITERRLLSILMLANKPFFIRWAFDSIVKWKFTDRPESLIHIHGDHDHILPIRYAKPDVVIKNGTHFMVWTKAREISDVLIKILDEGIIKCKNEEQETGKGFRV